MEIRKIKVNGNDYEFINQSRSTRNGFAHDTTLFKNGFEVAGCRCNYINRTWECYRYQTVMQRCVDSLIEDKYDRFIANYKAENNIKKLLKAKREEADKLFEELETIKELREVYSNLKHNN